MASAIIESSRLDSIAGCALNQSSTRSGELRRRRRRSRRWRAHGQGHALGLVRPRRSVSQIAAFASWALIGAKVADILE
jgi:hypothetical protein